MYIHARSRQYTRTHELSRAQNVRQSIERSIDRSTIDRSNARCATLIRESRRHARPRTFKSSISAPMEMSPAVAVIDAPSFAILSSVNVTTPSRAPDTARCSLAHTRYEPTEPRRPIRAAGWRTKTRVRARYQSRKRRDVRAPARGSHHGQLATHVRLFDSL